MEVNNLNTNRRAQIGNITIPLLKGEQGYSISRIVRTSGDGGAGSIDTYTVYIDTTPETAIGTFQVVNGTGGDMSKNVYDIDNDDIVDRATGDGNGNEITATYETIENVTALANRVATLEQAGYITKSVADLANYYLKSETYTKQEVNNLCDMIPKFAIEVVNVLPTQDISETTIYLLRDDEETQDVYQEYIYVNNTWERIGGQRIDLSNYYQKSETYSKEELNDKLVSVGTTVPTDGRRVWFNKGKNLYVGSQDFSGIWDNADMWTTANETYNGLVVKYRQAIWYGLYKEIYVQKGDVYTFSFFAKKEASGRVIAYYTGGGVGATPGYKSFDLTTEWQRFSFTFTITESGKLRARIENQNNDSITYICGYQLEKNNTMTSYEPYIIPSVNVDNEQICEKALDTGWIDISSYVVSSNFAIRSGYAPKARRIGNRVYLKGEVYCKTAVSNHTNKILASIPATFRPTDQFSSSGVKYDLGVPYDIFIGTNGDITVSEGQNISVTPDFKGYQLTNLSGFLVD